MQKLIECEDPALPCVQAAECVHSVAHLPKVVTADSAETQEIKTSGDIISLREGNNDGSET
jgi:hypothetical protein